MSDKQVNGDAGSSPTTGESLVGPAGASYLLRTFGRLELIQVARGTQAVPLLQRGKPLAMLVYCTAERRRAHARDVLCALLWADAAPERARHNVRQALWRLRRILGDLLATRDDAVLGVSPLVLTDREHFLDAVARQDVLDALTIYGGPFLDGLSFPGGDEFEEWATHERRRLEDALVRVVDSARADRSRLKPADRRTASELLLERAPDSLEARRVVIDLLLDLGDLGSARREADTLEAMAARAGTPLSATMRASVTNARLTVGAERNDEATAIALELVGRDEPFSRAMAAWSEARRGATQLLVFSGVAGVGKTRLLQALAQRFDGRRSRVVTVRAHVGEQDVPFGFAALLAHALASQPGAAGIASESARELVALDPGLASQFDVSPAAQDASETTRRRALALLDLLQAVAEQQPLVLLIDDLHWMDRASRQVLTIALGRLSDQRVLVIGATRPGVTIGFDHPTLTSVTLPPLEPDAVMDAILSSGSWPTDREADHFVHTLAGACDGIPLNVMERLTLALDAGLITRQHGIWSAPDWRIATQEVAVSSPLARRLQSCSERERDLLLMLAVAGTPLPRDVLAISVSDLSTLRTLETKGFVRAERDQWAPVHDAIVEQLVAQSAADTIAAAHRGLAAALARSRTADRLSAAVRHHQLGGDEAKAGELFAQLVGRARGRGDRRSARQLLVDTLGESASAASQRIILQAVPWHLRDARLGFRLTTAAALLVALASTALAWSAVRRPSLRLAQTSLVVTHAWLFGDDAYRLIPPVILATGPEDAANGVADSSARLVTVVAEDARTRILTGATVRTHDGVARFGGLRVATTDTIIRLRFESDGFRPVSLSVPVNITTESAGDGGIHLVGARFDSVTSATGLTGPEAAITVDRGAAITGVVQMEYSAPWPAASVWVSMTPTWGDAKTVGRDVFPVTTPVRWDVADVPVALTAPMTAGRYWILVVLAAEPSGGFALSGTNWSMERPLWGDGNDVAQLPDSVIRRSNERGLASIREAYPATHPNLATKCVALADPTVRYCPNFIGLFGLRVIVR